MVCRKMTGENISCGLPRFTHGLTQVQLARLVGNKKQDISRLEWGKQNASVDLLDRIAAALKMELRVTFEAVERAGRKARG